jgi:hypothetical protein
VWHAWSVYGQLPKARHPASNVFDVPGGNVLAVEAHCCRAYQAGSVLKLSRWTFDSISTIFISKMATNL